MAKFYVELKIEDKNSIVFKNPVTSSLVMGILVGLKTLALFEENYDFRSIKVFISKEKNDDSNDSKSKNKVLLSLDEKKFQTIVVFKDIVVDNISSYKPDKDGMFIWIKSSPTTSTLVQDEENFIKGFVLICSSLGFDFRDYISSKPFRYRSADDTIIFKNVKSFDF